jgi:hypothetical protein
LRHLTGASCSWSPSTPAPPTRTSFYTTRSASANPASREPSPRAAIPKDTHPSTLTSPPTSKRACGNSLPECAPPEKRAAADDLEAAAHHAYERHLADAAPALAGISSVAKNTTVGFVIGGIAGFLTMGITGPGGPLAVAALGMVPGAAAGVRRRTQPAEGARLGGSRQPDHRPDLTIGDVAEIKSFLFRTCDAVLSWLPGTGCQPAWQSDAARELSNSEVRADQRCWPAR